MYIEAVLHLQRMRGGSQSHLMRGDNGRYYVVKFQNNPQHIRVLSNELLATRLAESLGLPVAHGEIIMVSDELIARSPGLHIQLGRGSAPCMGGLQFGSQYVVGPRKERVFDYLPEVALREVTNKDAFAGMLVMDKWSCNADSRQAVFSKAETQTRYSAAFIDHGYCFNGADWTFPDSPLVGIFPRKCVYESITGWESFEPWLSKLEHTTSEQILECAKYIVPAWYGGDWLLMARLADALFRRRCQVRRLILEFRDDSHHPFPNWTQN